MDELFCEHTPIQQYFVRKHEIFVKRDDLYGLAPAPPLGKLRGLRILVERWASEGEQLIGYFDSPISNVGQGLAAICSRTPSVNCILLYPSAGDVRPPEWTKVATRLNAEILRVPGSSLTSSLAYAKRIVLARGGVMAPFGVVCPEAIQALSEEALLTPPEVISRGTLVLSCGSGVTLAGILRGLPSMPSKLVGICSRKSILSVAACLRRYLGRIPSNLELQPATIPYWIALQHPCPFPSNPYYDLKAWKYLEVHLEKLKAPIFFWNIGA